MKENKKSKNNIEILSMEEVKMICGKWEKSIRR